MISPAQALGTIPAGLRQPLLAEYASIIQNFLERRWSPSELSGGKFSEIVYTVLDGYGKGAYASAPSKPSNFVAACKKLESNTSVPRSFQILIPRLLPALYEIRNNRGVGHTGGDVDPNHMDAQAVVSMCNWVMAELVRVFHAVTVEEAQGLVDVLVERRVPLVWQDKDMKRVLDPKVTPKDQILLLIASAPNKVPVADLIKWTDTGKTVVGYFMRTLRQLHSARLVEVSPDEKLVQILPPGSKRVEAMAASASSSVKKKRRR